MDAGLLVGLIFMGCIPTIISSNVVMTKQAHGNQALTVVQSTLGNFLGPLLTPILVEMYISSGAWYTKVLPREGSFGELCRRVFRQLGLSIFLPLVRLLIMLTVLYCVDSSLSGGWSCHPEYTFPKESKKGFID